MYVLCWSNSLSDPTGAQCCETHVQQRENPHFLLLKSRFLVILLKEYYVT